MISLLLKNYLVLSEWQIKIRIIKFWWTSKDIMQKLKRRR